MRPLRILGWGLLAALLVFAAATYGGLPERIPSKIGVDGEVTRTTAKSVWSWFLLPLIALALQLLLEGIGALLPAHPQWFNFPEKERFLALPPAFQGPVIEEMRTMLDITQLGMLVLFGVIQYQLWRTARGHETSGLLLAAAILPVLLTPVALFWLTRITAALEREEERFRAGPPSGPP